jgi:hypothetical protein
MVDGVFGGVRCGQWGGAVALLNHLGLWRTRSRPRRQTADRSKSGSDADGSFEAGGRGAEDLGDLESPQAGMGRYSFKSRGF